MENEKAIEPQRRFPGLPPLRSRLQNRQVTIGGWLQLAHPAHAEILAASGYDWIVVDLEHSVITIREAEEMIRIIALMGVFPLVRVSSNDPVQIKRVMDAGAGGIVVPMVNSEDEAKAATSAVRYPPKGNRGVGLARAQGYGARFAEYWTWMSDECVVAVQIEHIDAVRNLDKILAVPGIDAFFVGSYDLSGSLGVPGEFNHPKMVQALDAVRSAASRHPDISPGFHVVQPDPKALEERLREGYRFVAYATDMILLQSSCRKGADDIARLRRSLNTNSGP